MSTNRYIRFVELSSRQECSNHWRFCAHAEILLKYVDFLHKEHKQY
jgi:hypothetical protein